MVRRARRELPALRFSLSPAFLRPFKRFVVGCEHTRRYDGAACDHIDLYSVGLEAYATRDFPVVPAEGPERDRLIIHHQILTCSGLQHLLVVVALAEGLSLSPGGRWCTAAAV